jgi:hypothetical protein
MIAGLRFPVTLQRPRLGSKLPLPTPRRILLLTPVPRATPAEAVAVMDAVVGMDPAEAAAEANTVVVTGLAVDVVENAAVPTGHPQRVSDQVVHMDCSPFPPSSV